MKTQDQTAEDRAPEPPMDAIQANSRTLEREMDWLEAVLNQRMAMSFGQDSADEGEIELPLPDLSGDGSVFAQICHYYRFRMLERLVLALALAPHVRPQLLDIFFTRNSGIDRPFTEFGGLVGKQHGGFLPTGETAAFLVADRDLEMRIRLLQVFGPEHPFARFGILKLEPPPAEEPFLSGALLVTPDYQELFTLGNAAKPTYSSRFPAQRLQTSLSWEDLVLAPEVRHQVEVVRTWVERKGEIMSTWQASRTLKQGYRALFYGPPGTGKTLTASLIGKSAGKDVYLIDGSRVVSKWVGETEKNLARVFDMAEHKDWILFFDEADALFGKRGNSGASQERYGNQQVSYLLQRTENYPGTVILATNLRGNIDEAFMRRFQSTIYFPVPSVHERQRLWEKIFAGGLPLEERVDLLQLARKFEVTGGSIVNVLKYCAIMAERRGNEEVMQEDIWEGVQRELRKEGKRV